MVRCQAIVHRRNHQASARQLRREALKVLPAALAPSAAVHEEHGGPAVPGTQVVHFPNVYVLLLPLAVGNLVPLDQVEAGHAPLHPSPQGVGFGQYGKRDPDIDEWVVGHSLPFLRNRLSANLGPCNDATVHAGGIEDAFSAKKPCSLE